MLAVIRTRHLVPFATMCLTGFAVPARGQAPSTGIARPSSISCQERWGDLAASGYTDVRQGNSIMRLYKLKKVDADLARGSWLVVGGYEARGGKVNVAPTHARQDEVTLELGKRACLFVKRVDSAETSPRLEALLIHHDLAAPVELESWFCPGEPSDTADVHNPSWKRPIENCLRKLQVTKRLTGGFMTITLDADDSLDKLRQRLQGTPQALEDPIFKLLDQEGAWFHCAVNGCCRGA